MVDRRRQSCERAMVFWRKDDLCRRFEIQGRHDGSHVVRRSKLAQQEAAKVLASLRISSPLNLWYLRDDAATEVATMKRAYEKPALRKSPIRLQAVTAVPVKQVTGPVARA